MTAVRNGNTVYVSPDIARALTGALARPAYRVVLHAMPTIAVHIEATSTDAAHAAVVKLVRAERPLRDTGATVTALPA